MAKTPQEIHAAYRDRSRARRGVTDAMLRLARFANGDIKVPLPELDEVEYPAVANLIAQGIDQLGARIGGRLPDVDFPALKPGQKKWEERASRQRQAVLGWWDMNRMDKKLLRRARYIVGYGQSPVLLRPVHPTDPRKIPHWHIQSPITCFPAPTGDPDCITPKDIIVVRQKPLSWLMAHYPEQMTRLYKGRNQAPDLMFDLLEYNDEDETVLVVCGQVRDMRERPDSYTGVAPEMVLERDKNRAGVCLGVAPTAMTIDRVMGHFDGILGMFYAQAKLTALQIISVSRNVFPEQWIMSHPGDPMSPAVLTYADGRQGIIGEIEHGTIQQFAPPQDQMTGQAIDRLERAQRVQGGIPADWGGESGSNIRTAKRGQEVASSTSDPFIGECQTIIAESMQAENERAIAIAKGWYGPKMTSFYLPRSGNVRSEDYRADELFDTDMHFVKFSMPGVDAAGIPIELGQRVQMGEMSMQTARESDPMIEDPELEERRTTVEGLRTALLKQLESQPLDPRMVALVAQRVLNGDQSLEDAVDEAHQIIQKEQAAMAQAQPGAPEAQPGMTAAPAGQPQQGGPQGQPTLQQALQGLRGPTNQSGAEQQLAAV